MNLTQKQIAIVGFGVIIFLVVAILVFFNLRPSTANQTQITVWGFEKSGAVSGLMDSYSQVRPNVKIAYKQVSRDNYENMLLGTLASGQGPDIFPVYNRGLAKNINVLLPAGTSQFSVSQVENLFPAEVAQDFTTGSNSQAVQVYALPLYFDTLSLIYNKDIFDQGGIVNPPASWEEFQADVAKLKSISGNGQIIRAGGAIGGSQKTITNAVDVLNVLMLQNGVNMTTQPDASFASQAEIGAFNFYLQFANPSSDYYTWNENQPDDLGSFSSGNTAMIFGYNSDVQKIKAKSPFLRFGVAPIPQVNALKAVNYADYWGLAVSKQSKNYASAWDFIIYMSTQAQVAGQYSVVTNQPPALRELIGQKLNDPAIGVYAKQSLTARSWEQPDENTVNNIFNNAIVSVLNNQSDSRRALEQAHGQVIQLLKTNNQ